MVAVGGGSTIGLGKAIALRTGLPLLAVPTTYAGSEMTPILGETEGGRKTTQRTPKVLPKTVIYDVELTLGLPPGLSATSGMNAMAHAVEALYAEDRNPVTSLMAEEGIRALAAALPGVVAQPGDLEARSGALYGAWLCGDLPGDGRHGAAPQALPRDRRQLRPAARGDAHDHPAARARLQRAGRAGGGCARGGRAGREDAAAGLFALAGRLGAPRALSAIGMREADIDRAADLAVETPYWNPRPIERAAIRELIARAWAGSHPA